MSFAICFNLDQSKILSSGNGLKEKNLRFAHGTDKVNTCNLLRVFSIVYSINWFL